MPSTRGIWRSIPDFFYESSIFSDFDNILFIYIIFYVIWFLYYICILITFYWILLIQKRLYEISNETLCSTERPVVLERCRPHSHGIVLRLAERRGRGTRTEDFYSAGLQGWQIKEASMVLMEEEVCQCIRCEFPCSRLRPYFVLPRHAMPDDTSC